MDDIIEQVSRFLIDRDSIVDGYDIYDILTENIIEEYNVVAKQILQIDRKSYNKWIDNLTLFLYNLDAHKNNRELFTEIFTLEIFDSHFYEAELLCGIIINAIDKPNPIETIPKECPYEVLCYDGTWHKIVVHNFNVYISDYASWLDITDIIGWRDWVK